MYLCVGFPHLELQVDILIEQFRTAARAATPAPTETPKLTAKFSDIIENRKSARRAGRRY